MATINQIEGEKPKLDEYKSWLIRDMGVAPVLVSENFYTTNSTRALKQFEGGVFWTSLVSDLKNVNARYQIDKKDILIRNFEPILISKPYSSFIEKTYRKNILQNKNWPAAPDGGWFLPDNWYSRIGDIIRSTIVVRYLDGVGFLSKNIGDLALSVGANCYQKFEGRIDGYYALHLDCQREVVLVDEHWVAAPTIMSMEVQITTEIKQLVKSLLHIFYENDRLSNFNEDWIWDYSSDKFSATNLGHMVHYIEGMLVQLRNKQVGL